MLRTAARLATAVLSVAAISGTSIAAAAPPQQQSAKQGAEHLVIMGISARSGALSVIATGLFTDGGTASLLPPEPYLVLKLGAGSIRLTARGAAKFKLDRATCLVTISGHNTYTLGHGTGKYAGIRGSGRFTITGSQVIRRKAGGACESERPTSHLKAEQLIIALTGSATFRS
jgi:hypothetical protein